MFKMVKSRCNKAVEMHLFNLFFYDEFMLSLNAPITSNYIK